MHPKQLEQLPNETIPEWHQRLDNIEIIPTRKDHFAASIITSLTAKDFARDRIFYYYYRYLKSLEPADSIDNEEEEFALVCLGHKTHPKN